MFPTFKTKEEVPAPFLELYEEKDGEWKPKGDDEVERLRGEHATERTKREAAEKLATKTAAELKKLQTQGKATDLGITDEKLQEIRAAVRKEVEDELAPKLTAGEKALAENRSLKLDSQIKKLAAEKGFLGDKLDDYWKLHGDEYDLTDDGKPMVKANPGQSVEKLLETHKAKRPEWVQGTKAGGGGAAGQQNGAPVTAGAMSVEDQLKNPSAGLAAARAAGKTE